MKHLSIEMGAIAALALSLCTSFSPANSSANSSAKSELATKPGTADKHEKKVLLMSRSEYYYWYSYPGNSYEGWMPTSEEVDILESELQEDVDTNPSGGYLIANGFVLYGLPHMLNPSVQLFEHP